MCIIIYNTHNTYLPTIIVIIITLVIFDGFKSVCGPYYTSYIWPTFGEIDKIKSVQTDSEITVICLFMLQNKMETFIAIYTWFNKLLSLYTKEIITSILFYIGT